MSNQKIIDQVNKDETYIDEGLKILARIIAKKEIDKLINISSK